ncbi:MAG: hypothetical protein IKJ01_04770 [Lachnospiraceae bacterium]|nr:hypothetical protein [Lachnospiraceae bacterium]
MKLYIMKRIALDTLKSEMKNIYSKYYIEETNEWMTDICGEDPFIEIAEVEQFELADLTMPKGTIDAENCKIIYWNLRKYISPSQASDERLWAGLCNGTFYEYLKKRWNYVGEIKGDADTNVREITLRFFFSGNAVRRGLYRNTLSKCWWVGYNLYDASNKEHFWRIDALGSSDFSSKVSDIFASNNFSSNITIVDGIIQALLYFKKRGIVLKQREHIRSSLQKLNAIGGAIILDELNKDEIAKIVIDNIETIIAGNVGALDFEEAESYEEIVDVEDNE